MAYFGEWLARRRAELGLTIRDVAAAADVAPARVSAWERGIEDPPYEVRDACWDALKRDGELPPLDPAPYLDGGAPQLTDGAAREAPRRGRRAVAPRTWLEEFAISKGTTLDAVLRVFGLSASLKGHWRAGKLPSRATQWKIAQFLEIPDELARANGWQPSPGATESNGAD